MKYDKLVRDEIPEIIRANGGNPIFHIASGEELEARLIDKLHEEIREFSDRWNLKALADIVEVCHRLAEVIGHDSEELEFERQNKITRNGGFSRNIVLEEA